MSLAIHTLIYSTLFFLSILNLDLGLSNFFYNNESLMFFIWLFSSLLLVFCSNNSNKYTTSIVLYVFGVYQSLVKNFTPTLLLIFKNLTTSIYFLIYNVKDFLIFLPKNQIWVPLFKRGGYLFLLNSMRTRWQLSKSNSIFKNK